MDEIPVKLDGAIVFMDEADACAFDETVKFNSEGNLAGLFYLQNAARIYFVSATFSEYAKELLGELLCKGFDNIPVIAPPNPIEIIKGGSAFNLFPFLCDSVESMWKTALEEIKAKAIKCPCVVFIAKHDAKRVKLLEALVDSRHFYNCSDVRRIELVKQQGDAIRNGIIVLPYSSCRGLDLKLVVDSHVFVIENTNTLLSRSTVNQMIGRSSRRAERSVGSVFASRTISEMITDIEHYIDDNEKSTSDDGL